MANEGTYESGTAPAFDSHDELAEPLRQGRLGDFQAKSDLASCLLPLLNAIEWRRDLREIAEALPHFANTLTLQEFRNVLARLGYKTISLSTDLSEVDPRLLPCLFVADSGGASVLLRAIGDEFRIFDGYASMERTVPAEGLSGTLYIISSEEHLKDQEEAKKENWVGEIFRRFRATIIQLAALTFTLNLLALMVPLFVMTVYDKVMPVGAKDVLASLVVGIIFVFAIDIGLRMVRSRIIAYMGGRVENLVATTAFKKILHLPTSLTEAAPLGTQVARLKEFDSLRELFMGPLVTVLLEVPFTFIFIIAIALLGGMLALIPIFMMVAFYIIAIILVPQMKRAVALSSRARAKRHGFLVESISHMRTIKEANAEEVWLDRYRDVSAEASFLQFKTAQITFLFQTLSQALMIAAGLATISFGVIQIINASMSMGALIASMALVWRVLAPLQSFFLTFSRFEQIKISLKQINQLMRMPSEDDAEQAGNKMMRRRFVGAVSLQRVSFRYSVNAEPALFGVTLEAQPGEMIAITGANGAGKTTLLRLILGLHRPQAGQVTMDGMDIRQIGPLELRQGIAYVPQQSHFFYGSIAQNLRLANPVASDDDLKEALHLAGALDHVLQYEDGLDTRMGDSKTLSLNAGLLQRLGLARAYLKRAPVLLLDEPAQTLDEEGDAAFVDALKKLKGSTTIFLVSHRPSHIRLADRLIVMAAGSMALEGKPETVLARLTGGGA